MAGRSLRGACFPTGSTRSGDGMRECAASGFMRPARDVVDDIRQGPVSREYADITPGFGTHHPQDVKTLPAMDDPKPIRRARPSDPLNLSKQDLHISDAEVLASIREGRLPRPGY